MESARVRQAFPARQALAALRGDGILSLTRRLPETVACRFFIA
jgi:hypothetical protein